MKKMYVILLLVGITFKSSGMNWLERLLFIAPPYLMSEFADDDEPVRHHPHEPSYIEKKICACWRTITGGMHRYIAEFAENLEDLGKNIDALQESDLWPAGDDH